MSFCFCSTSGFLFQLNVVDGFLLIEWWCEGNQSATFFFALPLSSYTVFFVGEPWCLIRFFVDKQLFW